MNVIFCDPKLTIGNHKDAAGFFQSCREILDEYVTDMTYISTSFHINRLLSGEIDRNDILIFFNALDGRYCDLFLKLVKKCNDLNEVQSVGNRNGEESGVQASPRAGVRQAEL